MIPHRRRRQAECVGDVYDPLRESLSLAIEEYYAVAAQSGPTIQDWLKNLTLLKSIKEQLQQAAQIWAVKCQSELDKRRSACSLLLEERACQYSELEKERSRLSSVDAQIVALTTQVFETNKEIGEKRREIEKNCEELRQAKQKQRDWNTAFWFTIFIPFAGIGVACKKAAVDNEYEAKAKVLNGAIEKLRDRIGWLNGELDRLRRQQRDQDQTSAELTRRITTIEGRVSQATAEINSLSSRVNLWQTVLQACHEIDIRLAHITSDLVALRRCFDKLLDAEKQLYVPETAQFVTGRTCLGSSLEAGASLEHGQYLISPNRKFIAVLEGTNELVVYNSQGELWSSGTQGAQGQGRLCLDGHGPAKLLGVDRTWTSKRPGVTSLVMQDDGNLVAYGADGQSLWASDTFTYANVDSLCFQSQAQ